MAVSGAILAPLAIPVLPPETYVRYTQALHLAPPAIGTHRLGPLPQIFADQFGWDEMAQTVARVYSALAPEVRAKTAIFGQNYGQAGPSTCSVRSTGCRPLSAGIKAIFCGARAATPARA
jgi:hypothetical protein